MYHVEFLPGPRIVRPGKEKETSDRKKTLNVKKGNEVKPFPPLIRRKKRVVD